MATIGRVIVLFCMSFVFVVIGTAAAQVSMDGVLTTELQWQRDALRGVTTARPYAHLSVNLGLDTEDDSTRGFLELGLAHRDWDWRTLDGQRVVVEQAFIETEGSVWWGGPTAAARFGTLDLPGSPETDWYGFQVEDLDIGPFRFRGFYGLPTSDGFPMQGVGADAYIHGIDLSSTIVVSEDHRKLDFDGVMSPAEQLTVGGAVTLETMADFLSERFWTMGAVYQTREFLALYGGYHAVSTEWAPLTVHTEHGYYLGAAGTLKDVEMQVEYDQLARHLSFIVHTVRGPYAVYAETLLPVLSQPTDLRSVEITAGVESQHVTPRSTAVVRYEWVWVRGSYVEQTVGTRITLDTVPSLRGLQLAADLTTMGLVALEYTFGAQFEAPNGVYVKLERHGGIHTEVEMPVGTSVTVGTALRF